MICYDMLWYVMICYDMLWYNSISNNNDDDNSGDKMSCM